MNRIYQLGCLSGVCGIVLATMGGCAAQERKQAAFFPQRESRAIDAAAEAQAGNGARRDGMLRAVHFDGDQLNALGQRKLDLMARGIGEGTLTVYVDVPDKEAADEDHRQVIVAYLHDQGLKDEQIQVKHGINPSALGSAEAGLSRLSKTENPGAKEGQSQSQSGTSIQTGSMLTSP
jgi:hypothetical protein